MVFASTRRMKLAAIDIGSNAIRLQISTAVVKEKVLFKRLEYVRYPLRLGHDVFSANRISEPSRIKFKKLMKVYKLLLELYEVHDYMFCATSAMRESENGEELAAEVQSELGIKINIIDGAREGELIKNALFSFLDDENYLHIDVGGGSTELNLIARGRKINSRSFKVGSVRILERHDSPLVWEEMERWVKMSTATVRGKLTAIGTGGNISKIYELAQKKPGQTLSIKKMKEICSQIENTSMDDRIYRMMMNPDRADVIVPAGGIYQKVMEWAGSKKIAVPDVGLKDGILLHLFEKNRDMS